MEVNRYCLAALCAALCSGNAFAAEDIWTRDKLTGEWGELRTDLTKHGIDIDLRLSQYWQGVTDGGRDENDEYGGTMDYRINLDGPKLFGSWEGFSINIHARTRFGEDINAEAGELVLPNTGMLMPAPGDYHDTDITGLTVSQYLPFFGGLANLSVGKFDVVDTVNGFFPNLSYGQEGFFNINSGVSALPWFGAVRGLSLYGTVGVTVNQDYGMPESGIIALGTENVSTTNGQLADSFKDGVFLAAFHRFLWRVDEKPGYFMVFVGGSTADQKSNDPHDFFFVPGQGIENDKEKNPWDVAVYVHQEFWQAKGDPDRRAYVKIGGTAGPDNPQFSQYNAFGHVEFLGFMDSRPHDRMGAGMWWNSLSDNYKDLVSPVADLQDLYGFELYYNYQITPWMHLTADIQYVQNEWKADDMAVIPGARLVIDF
jgi:porin